MSRSSTVPLEQPSRQQSSKVSRSQTQSQPVSGRSTQGLLQSQASSGRRPAPQSRTSSKPKTASRSQTSISRKTTPPPHPKSVPGQWDNRAANTKTAAAPLQPPSRAHSIITAPKMPHRHIAQYTQRIDTPPDRHSLGSRQDSIQTRYMTMLLELDDIPRMHNILASFFTWVLLAGFIIFPGTYTTITSNSTNSTLSSSAAGSLLLTTIKHSKLLIVGSICAGIGSGGMLYLCYLHHTNYVWLLQRIFLPGVMNSLMGGISTLISVYAHSKGVWSATAEVTGAVIAGCLVGTGMLFGVYNFWLLRRVKKEHQRTVGERVMGREGEGLKEMIDRKANEKSYGGIV